MRHHLGVFLAGDDHPSCSAEEAMGTELTMIYWKGRKYWLGKLREHPEIMTQGRTLKELEENLRDAYRLMVLEDVPAEHREKAIAV
jgi:predicted RNase H-like HicB family nuclease